MKSIASVLSVSLFTLALAGEAHAGLCAYAVADIEGEVLAHPVVVVQLTEGSLDVDPVLVHVDSTTQTVLGYSIATPAVDYQTDPISIFLPGVDETVEQHVHALFDLEAVAFACLHGTVATPAIPIYIPASSLQIPGTQTDVPAITVNWLGQNLTYPGKVIHTDGHEIYVPAVGFAVPPVNVTVPDKAIAVTIDQSTEIIPVLAPLVIDDP
jgi:hypothetical protein